MLTPLVVEAIARERRLDAQATAGRVRLVRSAYQRSRRPLRTRAGWWLVEAGIRLVMADRPQRARLPSPSLPPHSPMSQL